MSEPTSQVEYEQRYHQNHKLSGYGVEGVTQHMPCPFCAAPDWLVHRIIDSREAFAQGATCRECGRSARALYSESHGALRFEFVQTLGPDQPDWMTVKMRRLEPITGGLADP